MSKFFSSEGLTGKRLTLSPLSLEEIPAIKSIFSDQNTLKLYLPTLWQSFNSEQLPGLLADWHDERNNFVLAIKFADNGKIIGLINLDDINWQQRRLEMGIVLISEFRGLGLASEAVQIILNYVFMEMNIHRVSARILANNLNSIRLFTGNGFKMEGELRDFTYRNGQYWNMQLFSLLDFEYKNYPDNNYGG